MASISWLHISDLHINSEYDKDFNSQKIFQSFIDDLSAYVNKNGYLDFIFISGDTAHGGKDDEYTLSSKYINRIIEASHVDVSNVVIVPGNHDIDFDEISMGDTNIVSALKNNNDVKLFFQSKKDVNSIFGKFANYNKFVEKIYEEKKDIGDNCFNTYNLSIQNKKVTIVAINSVWAYDKKRNKNLIVGGPQINQLLSNAEKTDLVIAIMHHPFDWLIDYDRKYVEKNLRQFCDIILRGHMHEEDVICESTLNGNIAIIPAGALHSSENSQNCYNIVKFDLENREGVVYLRRYSNNTNEWVKDVISTGDKLDGQVSFSMEIGDNMKAPYYSVDDYEKISSIYKFDDFLNTDIEKSNLNIREYLYSCIDDFEESFKSVPPQLRLTFIEDVFYDGGLKHFEPLSEYIKSDEFSKLVHESKIVKAVFTRYILGEYYGRK